MMKYALVTGATSGIGAEYAHQLAEAGHNIIVVSNRDGENGIMAERLRRECGVQAEPLYADLAQADAAEKIYAWCRARQAEVDILVSNAGILHFGLLTRTDTAAIDRIVTLHCTTPAKLCRLFAADMCRRGEGRILLMSSITAWTPYPTMSLYGSTKAFLRNFGAALHLETCRSGVSVTTVFPGGSRHTPLRPHAATPAAASAAGAYDVGTRGRAPRPEGNDELAQELHAGPRCQDRDAAVPSAPRTRRDASDAAAGRTTHAGEVTCKVRNTAAGTKSGAAEREKRQ